MFGRIALILLHRYLGIGVGLLVLLWCLSGFVMMYIPYPSESRVEQLAGLDPLVLDGCCRLPGYWPGDMNLDGAEIETLVGKPTLRLARSKGGFLLVDLSSGKPVERISEEVAQAVAKGYSKRDAKGGVGAVFQFTLIERDQWTVQGGYNAHRPLYRFALNDVSGTERYVSSTTGQVVLETVAHERFWNWLGSVVHWLYPTELRRHGELWSQVVIWTSLVGLFLTVTGLYVGMSRYRVKGNRQGSPYKSWHLWHHYLGLTFGLLTLTWVASGLLSMNPFGVLEGRSFATEKTNIMGIRLTYATMMSELGNLGSIVLPVDTVRLSASVFAGEFAWIGWTADGISERLGEGGTLSRLMFERHAPEIRPDANIDSMGSINEADAYYYGLRDDRPFPVFRVIYNDGERLYLDESSGQILQGIDGNGRWYRWLFQGFHRGDFAAWMRQRPLWDFLMIGLLAGVTSGAATGVYLGYKRITA